MVRGAVPKKDPNANQDAQRHPEDPNDSDASLERYRLLMLRLIMPPNSCFVLGEKQAAASVIAKKDLQHSIVSRSFWIPLNPYCLGVSIALANTFIRGALRLTPAIPNNCIDDATRVVKGLLWTPESAKSKSCNHDRLSM